MEISEQSVKKHWSEVAAEAMRFPVTINGVPSGRLWTIAEAADAIRAALAEAGYEVKERSVNLELIKAAEFAYLRALQHNNQDSELVNKLYRAIIGAGGTDVVKAALAPQETTGNANKD